MLSIVAAPVLLTTLLADATGMERRLWEVQVRKFEQLDREVIYPRGSVLFFGSSSIRRWDTIAADMAPYPVIQRGYGGARLSDAVGYVERVVYPHQFNALVLFVANDLQGKSGERTPAEVAKLFDELLAKVRSKYPATPVFWVEVTPTPSRWHAWPDVQAASKLIRASCDQDPNAYFVSTAHLFLVESPDGPRPRADLFVSDGLHLNETGYQLWSEAIHGALDRVLESQPQTVEVLRVPSE